MDAKAPRVTPADVDAIADQLALTGVTPTTLEIRRRLGRGSNTTVSNALARWRARKAAATAPGVTLTLPEPIIKAVAAWIEAQIAEVTQAANGRIADEETARKTATVHADELEAQVETLVTECQQLRAERDQNAGRLAQLQEDTANERVRLAADTKAAEDRAHAAEVEIASLRAKLEAAHERVTAAEARSRVALGQGKSIRG